MNAELKQKWIQRLKSGKEKKCKGGLHIGSSFCTMGLLLDEIDNSAWRYDKNSGHFRYGWSGPNGLCFNWVPSSIEKQIGISQVINIMIMNDKQDNSFEEIAQYIEENIPSE